jgi:predicted DsbA family dithiol-disulfide isomerase
MNTATDAPRTLTIDIWSDVMCPWCLVGWGQLQKGLELLSGELDADIRWHAFQLNPDMPNEGEDRAAHLARKYGRSRDDAKSVQGTMQAAAQNAGVTLEYTGGKDDIPPAMMWNTAAAHQLLIWTLEAKGAAKQTELKLALFEAHFNHRRAIGDEEVLIAIADEVGITREEAEIALRSDFYAEKVRAEQQAAYDMNVTGVPAMLVEGRLLIPGAQEPEVYANALRRVAARIPATPAE